MAAKLPSNKAVEKALPSVNAQPSMDIFISHSSKDEALAGALAILLHLGLGLDAKKIRCTSVTGYRLELGARTNDRLKAEVHDSRVLIGLVTPESVQSSYVLFELGARWGLGKFMGPLVAKGPMSILPGPLRDINALRADDEGQMHQFLRDVAKELELPAPDPAVYTHLLKEFVKSAAENSLPADSEAPAPSRRSLSREETLILKELWPTDDGCTFNYLAGVTKLSLRDVKYYVSELDRDGYVRLSVDADDGADVTISQDGRRYLKDRGLV